MYLSRIEENLLMIWGKSDLIMGFFAMVLDEDAVELSPKEYMSQFDETKYKLIIFR